MAIKIIEEDEGLGGFIDFRSKKSTQGLNYITRIPFYGQDRNTKSLEPLSRGNIYNNKLNNLANISYE